MSEKFGLDWKKHGLKRMAEFAIMLEESSKHGKSKS